MANQAAAVSTPQPASPPRRLLNYREVAELLGVSERTVYQLVADGEITPTRIGVKCVRFHPDEVDRIGREGVS